MTGYASRIAAVSRMCHSDARANSASRTGRDKKTACRNRLLSRERVADVG